MSKLIENVFALPFEKISQRPSKTYFYSKFIGDLKIHSDVERAADIASARFDNAYAFNSRYYYGVDLDGERLRTGLEKHPNSSSHVAIQADITKPIFQDESLDIIACSHTLSHLDQSEHLPLVRRLIEYLKSDGSLFIQFHEDAFTDDIERTLREAFEEVTVIRYKNPVSEAYERNNTNDNGMIDVDLDGWNRNVNGFLILLLASLEYLPLLGGSYTYARCLRKK